ncbi:LysE family transporter [Alicyclobacillus fastidiosus]|uniref:LysE family transporter n=1 Tax=Alicyclobacillus fastidiosus TaxID=392011 RepID=A0ABY6ZJV0_9BACL|nr:LysE family transporter [Alicyclobacillus fastidiosus]WAH42356.1 LysE family transporter [Alicyclobacillus fastidiosus]GMA64164.1 putative amino-acid transporter YisU [Alicyclobacillus fastidiosus]
MFVAFIHGFLLSLGLILPIGMQNGFILTQGALHSRWSGSLPAVITASICDTFLIALAVLGVSTVALHITWLRYTFGAIGIVFLLYMGWSTWRVKNAGESNEISSTAWTAKRQIGFTSSVSLLNPHALIDTLAVIGGSAVAYTAWTERIAFGIASATVSWLWFLGLSIAGHMVGKVALRNSSLQALNRVSATMMWLSAVYLGYVIYSFK